MGIGERIEERLESLKLSQSELARRVGLRQSTIHALIKGQSRSSAHLHKIARELETSVEFLTGETDDPADGAPVITASREDLVEVAMIDFAYGMGGTYLEDSPEVRLESFPLAFIRHYTKAKAEDLVIAEGVGDSMMPTIGPNDLVLIDRSKDSVRMADQIWAFGFGDVGMIKRLRPRPDGSVAILSDNPNVPEDRAVDGELHVIGRVVGKFSKL